MKTSKNKKLSAFCTEKVHHLCANKDCACKCHTENKIKRTIKYLVFLIPAVLLLATIIQSALAFSEFHRNYEFHIQNIFRIEPRQKSLVNHSINKAEAKEVKPKDMTTEEYICYVFGKNCKMALAISQAENGTRQCDRIGINTNNSIDLGVFQINSIHLKKGWRLLDVLDCHKNIDYAYEIYKAQGWSPWVAYQNGSYKQYLK